MEGRKKRSKPRYGEGASVGKQNRRLEAPLRFAGRWPNRMHNRSGLWFDGLATSGRTRKCSMSATFALTLSKGKERGVRNPLAIEVILIDSEYTSVLSITE